MEENVGFDMIFDTHSHYDDKQFDTDRDELLKGLYAAGVECVVDVGADLASSERAAALSEKYENVLAAVGIHPDSAFEADDSGIERLKTLAKNKKVVAIGEIGLDYHWMVCEKEVQENAFRRQIHLAAELSLPVIIHSRDAAEDTYRIMKDEEADICGGVVHCFSYSAEMALKYLEMGMYIGIGGVLTYKNGRKLKEVAAAVPMERIVLETDCPYLAPDPHRGKRNDSSYIRYVAEELARIKNISYDEVVGITRANALKMYGLDKNI